jgi:ankyrin repeat protein
MKIDLVKSFDISLTALTSLLGKSGKTNNIDPILSIINSFLPNTAFLEGQFATGFAIERVEELKPVTLLNLTIFWITNNFPGRSSSELLYKWLKSHGITSLLKALSSMKGPTAEALLEKFFRLAIEAEDIQTVRYFIEEGVSVNGCICRHPLILDNLTPLQFACIRGNIELAQELIKAGSSIDQPRTGWKSSALVLAIMGENLRGRRSFWDGDQGVICDENDDEEFPDEVHSQEGLDRFTNLINSLIDAGASVNVDVTGGSDTMERKRGYEALSDRHSPLTVASKYRILELVDIFIKKGADVNFLTDHEMSALHECLYSWEEMSLGEWYLSPHCQRRQFFPGSKSVSKIVSVVRSLLKAGVDVNDEYCVGYCDEHDQCDCPSSTTLDLSLLTGNIEIVDMILCAGARTTTEHSVEHAIEMESVEVLGRLLRSGAPLSKKAFGYAMEKDSNGRYVKALLAERQSIRTKRAVLVEAIKYGARSTIVHLFKDETSNHRKLFQKSPDLTCAIERCCEKGNVDILHLILEKSLTYQVSISPMFGRSLYMAALNNQVEIIGTILSAGMEVNAMAKVEDSALLAAIKNQHKRVTEILINAGAMLNPKSESGSNCIQRGKASGNILITAIQLGDLTVIKNLVEAGADVNAFGNASTEPYWECSCIRPLTAAVMRKDFYLINYLISAGAVIDPGSDCDGKTMTVLSAAVRNQDFELVDFLLHAGANPYDARALEEATNNFRLLQVLLTALLNRERPRNGTDSGIRALNKAMEKQDEVMVRAIINSPLKYFKSTESALHGALLYDSGPDFEVTRMLLIPGGADPNCVWKYEHYPCIRSPLFVAIGRKSPQKVQLLLEAGAEPDKALTCGMQRTPMQLAVSDKQHDIVRKLLSHKADPSAISRTAYHDHRTPIQIAVHNRDIEMVRVLLQNSANPNAAFSEITDWMNTPLQRACKDGSKEIVELLLVHGADVNATHPKNCTTALQIAATQGFLGIAYLLLKHGADVNAPAAEVNGWTALEGAAEHGRVDMIQLLFNAGASISEDGQSQYESALRRASENGHHAVRRLLESYLG